MTGPCNIHALRHKTLRPTLWTSIQTNMLELPSERPLSGTEGPHVPYIFLRYEGFALNRNILRHFGGIKLT